MLKRILFFVGVSAVVLGLGAAVLYQFFGLRVVVLGGGRPSLAFVTPADRQAQEVEQHRAAQAAEPPVPLAPVETTPTADPAGTVVVADGETSTATTAAPTSVPDWGFFRGPRWDGHYVARAINTEWPNRELTPVWKQPIGGGYASFVTARIAGRDLAFTIEQRGRQEVVAAYDVATGREMWTNAWNGEFKEFMGGDGPRATPTYFDGRVYAQGTEGELRSLNATTGTTVWRTNILADAGASNIQWGISTSPLIVDDALVTLPGGRGGQSVVAYNHRTGERMWSALGDTASYSSPMLVEIDGVRQILMVSASRLMGLAPANGALLWEFPWMTMYDVNAGQPIVFEGNRVFMSSGYDHGAVVVEVTMNGSRGKAREVWKNNRMKNQFTSSVLHDGYFYGLDEAIMACVRASDGQLMWKGGRYGYGQIALASGHIVVLTEDGDMALVRATPEKHDELTRFPVLDGKTWNHPAFSDGRLLVRNINQMAMFDLRK
ncbi:MAG: PQQ-like beta-propeller repeat protein [Acidobacteria bacterium]|nr:PQQ-like beta-propeller repeat protein [Acidobacteriota bacterium]